MDYTKGKFLEVLSSDELKNVTEETLEIVVDEIADSEIVDKVPVVGLLKALYKTGKSIQDALFLKKAMHVLLELSEVTSEVRLEFVESLNSRFSSGTEIIMNAIDKLESNEKSVIFGRLCRLRAKNQITQNQFLELTKLIQDAYLPDLIEFGKMDRSFTGSVYEDSKFIRLGLLSVLVNVEESKELPIYHDSYSDAQFVRLDGLYASTDYSVLGEDFRTVYETLFEGIF